MEFRKMRETDLIQIIMAFSIQTGRNKYSLYVEIPLMYLSRRKNVHVHTQIFMHIMKWDKHLGFYEKIQ